MRFLLKFQASSTVIQGCFWLPALYTRLCTYIYTSTYMYFCGNVVSVGCVEILGQWQQNNATCHLCPALCPLGSPVQVTDAMLSGTVMLFSQHSDLLMGSSNPKLSLHIYVAVVVLFSQKYVWPGIRLNHTLLLH